MMPFRTNNSDYSIEPSEQRIADRIVDNVQLQVEDTNITVTFNADSDPTLKKTPLKRKHMDMKLWAIQEHENRLGSQQTCDVYSGDVDDDWSGFNGIVASLIEDVAEQIMQMAGPSASKSRIIEQFNEVTEEWPHEARSKLAAYFAYESDVENEDFIEEAERFAELDGMDDFPTQDNGAGEVPDQKPISALMIWAAGYDGDAQEVLDSIDSTTRFKEELVFREDVSEAAKFCKFPDEIPDEVVEKADDVDEWPDGESVADIERENCVYCQETIYYVYIDGAKKGVSTTGVKETEPVGHGALFYYLDGPVTGRSVICDKCEVEWENGHVRLAFITDRGIYRFKVRNGIVKNCSLDNGLHYENLPERYKSTFDTFIRSGNVSDMFQLHVNDGPADGDSVEDALDEVLESGEGSPGGEFVITEERGFSGSVFHAHVPEDPRDARFAKQFFEQPAEMAAQFCQ